MGRFRTFAIAGVSALGLSAQAQAADMPSMPMPSLIQRPVVEDFAAGWYLRGDLGYRANTGGDVIAAGAPSDTKYDSSYMLGGGVGYKWQWLRVDATFDYSRNARYTGTTTFG